MIVDPSELSPLAAYKLATSLIVPRPIAWVGTQSKAGATNIAPFSYFMGVSSQPPSLAISVARGRNHSIKDTAANILETGEFSVSVVSHALCHPMVQSSLPLPPDVSEFVENDLDCVQCDTIAAPRPLGAVATMECKLVHAHEMASVHLLVGEVTRYHIDDAAVHVDEKGHSTARVDILDPIARLGGYDYCRVTEVFTKRPQK